MKRRDFIQTSSIVTLPILLRGMEVTAISKSKLATLIGGDEDKVLVLVQLNGGNDGLNCFIPLDEYDNLMNVRPKLMIPENKVLKATDANGFHSALSGFKSLYDHSSLAVVQSVGYPNQNRSHFRSTDIWTSASDSDQYITTGWLGRYFQLSHPAYPEGYPNEQYPDPFAITIGSVVSETCQGTASNYSFAVKSKEDLASIDTTEESENASGCYSSELLFVKDIIRQTNAYSEKVLEAFELGNNIETYEDNSLASQLKIVANLISGGLKTKIYIVSQGGYDTHANQVVESNPETGEHATLMSVLGNAIKSFQNDLIKLGVDKKVIGMTFSEFGRRIKANDSIGTDHGSASPLFLFGSCINANVFGNNPEIGTQVDADEGLAMQNDFRSVYASILMDWFNTPKEDIQKVLFKEFQHIPFINSCTTQTLDHNANSSNFSLTVSPNPTQDLATIIAKVESGLLNIDIYDSRGGYLKNIMSRKVIVGEINANISLSDLSIGTYYVRLSQNNKNATVKIVKI